MSDPNDPKAFASNERPWDDVAIATFERNLESPFDRVGGATRNPRQLLQGLAERAANIDLLTRYAAQCPVAGTGACDYAPRLIQLTPDCAVIAGIHFRRMCLDFPFIDVSVQSGPLPFPHALNALAHHFRLFQPRAIRLWRAAHAQPPETSHDDLVIVSGLLTDLLSATPARNSGRVRLELDPWITSYGEYRCLYETLHSTSPEVSNFARPETRQSLHECAEHGAFFRVLIDDRNAGFIAARPDEYRQWKGWEIVEEVLHPEFRGKGFGPAVQQALLVKLDNEVAPAVFGTIAAENLPSLKTALRVGRRVVEISSFIYLTP
jgi:RimJ/RimL family protein N-acetyltransferase